jgi:hypothetical protein
MPHHQHPTTIAIIGADALAEDVLAQLLGREGYSTRHLEASYPTGPVSELLDGVDVVLVAPSMRDSVREAFLEAIRSTPKTAAIPVLPLSGALKHALLDELSANLSWRHLFEELVKQIQDDLEAVGAKALELDAAETA